MEKPADAKPVNPKPDFSRDIEKTVKKEPLDRVRCVRVFEDYYRCNWWSPTLAPASGARAFDWAVSATHFIRKSCFYKVTLSGEQLVLEERVVSQ